MFEQDVRIAPSVLSADFLNLQQQLDAISNADLVHYDVMDGHFVPNHSLGVDFLKSVKAGTNLPVDVHLMVSNPEECVGWYLDAGADIVGFHMEAQTHANRLVQLIHDHGAKASIVINPATQVSILDAIIEDVDVVLVMGVNPGFSGQRFIPSTLTKLRQVVSLCRRHEVSPIIEVDGGIKVSNVADAVSAGARMIVAGSAIFGKEDPAAAVDAMRAAAREGLGKSA